MVDAPALGAGGRKPIEVRVLSMAPSGSCGRVRILCCARRKTRPPTPFLSGGTYFHFVAIACLIRSRTTTDNGGHLKVKFFFIVIVLGS